MNSSASRALFRGGAVGGADMTAREHDATRDRIGLVKALPALLADRAQGATEDEISKELTASPR
jgi:hypothetical protein